ncbi:hypothetical protein [Lutibacter citreus]|uniref:hypothetical protein n=1 Tax=Lutibacter citreus TaxID=2138210 RepID=UPI000DBE790B|nr:hypothetical protein [Lutibacter citreus]
MGKQFGLTLLLGLFLLLSINAQRSSLTFKQVDSISYALFLKQDWKQLIKFSKRSRAEGIDFYYLKVRTGIGYFKKDQMLLAIKYLEQAHNLNAFDVVVQEYLYWAYRYAGFLLESDMFYNKMSKDLQNKIQHKLKFLSAIDVGVVSNSNLDSDKEFLNNSQTGLLYLPEDFQMYTLGLNHRFSNNTNFYHRLTVMQRNSVAQELINTDLYNTKFNGKETRYYANGTLGLGNRWYLELFFNVISGDFEEIIENSTGDLADSYYINSGNKISYSDVVFGTSISKASYYFSNSINVSYSTLNNLNQFQLGYNLSFYPLGNTVLIPFVSAQYVNETGGGLTDSRIVYTGGVSINKGKLGVTGFVNAGEIINYISNNGSIIYNQTAAANSEIGLLLKVYLKKVNLKIGYSFMKMEDSFFSEDTEISNSVFKFNQQNIIGGLTWEI